MQMACIRTCRDAGGADVTLLIMVDAGLITHIHLLIKYADMQIGPVPGQIAQEAPGLCPGLCPGARIW